MIKTVKYPTSIHTNAPEEQEANAYEQCVYDDMPLFGYETQDILNEILDVVNSYSSAKQMILALEADQIKLKKDENAYFDSLMNKESEIVENFEDEIFAQMMKLDTFTPQELDEIQQILNEYENTEEIEAGNGRDNNQASPYEQDNEMPGAENPVGSVPVERGGVNDSSQAVSGVSQLKTQVLYYFGGVYENDVNSTPFIIYIDLDKSIASRDLITEHKIYVTATPINTPSGTAFLISDVIDFPLNDIYWMMGFNTEVVVDPNTKQKQSR